MTSQQPALSASMNAMAPMSAAAKTLTPAANTLSTAANTMSAAAQTLSSSAHAVTASSSAAQVNAMPATMTAAAPAATVLPNMTLQPNVTLQPNAPYFDKSLNEKPVTEKTVDKILSEKQPDKRAGTFARDQPAIEWRDAAVAVGAVGGRGALDQRHLAREPARGRDPAARRLAADRRAHHGEAGRGAAAAAAADRDAAADRAGCRRVARGAAAARGMPAAPTARHEEHNFRVLAVDDSPLMRTFLQNKLAPYGIHPEFAASGEEALFKISKQHYDLIFLDVMLPGMDGYDVCKMIKKNKDNALMKVVMLTSKDKTFDKIRGTMAGCDGYLTKPVDEMKLRAIIERHSVAHK